MARYIDADKLWNDRPQVSHEKSLDYKAGFIECMRKFSKLIREQIDNPTADVAPKSEVERLKAELDWIQARHPFAMTLFELEACEKHAAIKAVKEVWRELRSKCDAPHWCVWLSEIDDYFEKKTGVETEDIAELKKKYTEEKG